MTQAPNNPFLAGYVDADDRTLVGAARSGDRAALEALVRRHQDFIFNVAHKLVLNPFDAEDVTQEVLIKVITKLGSFKGESAFRTWLYRIVFNHFLQMKRSALEELITDFEGYGAQLDKIPDEPLSASEQEEMAQLVEEAKLGCMVGMLLCLDREQRIVYILGEVFGADHRTGAELLGVSPDNFRQRLSRARTDLSSFMHRKCGLVNAANPCRCAKKTKGFIAAGWVEPHRMKFNTEHVHRVHDLAGVRSSDLDDLLAEQSARLQQAHPFQQKDHIGKLLTQVLQDERLRGIFAVN
jgi:RNA polymerase sigma factor (sigma-70 family)